MGKARIFLALSLASASTQAFAHGSHAGGDSARIEIRAYMPLICGAEITAFQVVSNQPLVVDATVRQSCNGDHEISVNYDPESVTNTGDLAFVYDGRTPSHASLGSVGFGAEHHTDVVRSLRITYAGGSDAQRAQFAHTIAIAVTPR